MIDSSRYYRAFEVFTGHAIRRPSGQPLVALLLIEEIHRAIMPSTVLINPEQDRVDRLQFLLDSNLPAAFMVLALVDELDRMALETLPGGGDNLRADMEAELADIRRTMHFSLANVRAEIRSKE